MCMRQLATSIRRLITGRAILRHSGYGQPTVLRSTDSQEITQRGSPDVSQIGNEKKAK